MSQRPLPRITPDNKRFWDAAAQNRLVLPHCQHCKRFFYPIAPICPICLSGDVKWRELSGRGKVSSWIVFRKAFFPYFEDKLPYAVVQVELEEGPRINGNLLGVAPDAIRIGMPVRATFETITPEIHLPQFEAAG